MLAQRDLEAHNSPSSSLRKWGVREGCADKKYGSAHESDFQVLEP